MNALRTANVALLRDTLRECPLPASCWFKMSYVGELARKAESADHPIYGLAEIDDWAVELQGTDLGSGWETTQDGVTLFHEQGDSRIWVVSGSSFGDNKMLDEQESIRLDAHAMTQSRLGPSVVRIDDDPKRADALHGAYLLDDSALAGWERVHGELVEQTIEAIVQTGASTCNIKVDGNSVVVRVLRHADAWFARGTVGGASLIVMGTGAPVESCELAAVSDLAPYIDGARRLSALDEDDDELEGGSYIGVATPDGMPTDFDGWDGEMGPPFPDMMMEGFDPNANAALTALATALSDQDAGTVVGLLAPSVLDRHGGPEAYREQLAEALTGAGGLRWYSMPNPGPWESTDLAWGNLSVGSSPFAGPDSRFIQALVRKINDDWLVDVDVLDPTYQPKFDASEMRMDYRRMFGLPAYDELPFEPFALREWDGPIGLGGAGSGGPHGGLSEITLVFGSPWKQGEPRVSIETSTSYASLSDAVYELAAAAIPHDPSMSHRESRQLHDKHEQLAQEIRLSPRETVAISVDGVPVEFEAIVSDTGCAARASVNDLQVLVTATRVDLATLDLVQVSDLEPFVDGSGRAMAEMQKKDAAAEADGEPDRVIAIATVGPSSPQEEEFLDFLLDIVGKLEEFDASNLAKLTSGHITTQHGGIESFTESLAAALVDRPIIHSGWASQPRMSGTDRGVATIELLFKGDNPLRRWREIELVMEHHKPRLDVDLVAWASGSK